MIEQIAANLYKIEIPLPDMVLQFVNSYIIKAKNRNLIIDTGMDNEEGRQAMHKSLEKLGVDLERTDLFITHFHMDHFGLAPTLISDNSTIYFNKTESAGIDWVRSGNFLQELTDSGRMSGFPEDELQEALTFRPVHDHWWRKPLPFTFLADGDRLEAGEYRFQCVATPGHSRGHMCLYEPDKKIFISGDHLLNEITPSILSRYDAANPLEEYLLSLDRVYELDIKLVLPGHKGSFRNCKERIRELKDHHRQRSNEIISILKECSQNAYQVASQMTWNIDCDSWGSFPAMQKFFATGEAIAHLKYLEGKGMIKKETREKEIMYSRI
ncbi:MAG TPA: MBL fold metallo-hydrolase [Syntrophorhabdaceae bacterium]|nr:MBL fold metallo-hydrolase [Syntrophorhabdaceae bacterium]HQM80568.1 MBL fold metallo-hydrolase [Syntrophorhabdaceae bacterium]